jgi:hypothetical protein
MRGFLWPTEFLVFSDFLVADPHAHGALQLSVGIDGKAGRMPCSMSRCASISRTG